MWALSTRGEPDEIELTAMGVKLNGPRCRSHAKVGDTRVECVAQVYT